MNAFEVLGIEARLDLSDELLASAYREAGRRLHPDAGGEEGAFSALRDAHAVLCSPSRRLKHWLEIRGTPGDARGSIDDSLMSLFSRVGSVTQQADAVVRKRDEAKSALGRALLEGEIQQNREAVEQTLRMVEVAVASGCEVFPEFDQSAEVDLGRASEVARNLAFLERWKASLRSAYSRLV
jgi:curved DNA-binding protein CbpA